MPVIYGSGKSARIYRDLQPLPDPEKTVHKPKKNLQVIPPATQQCKWCGDWKELTCFPVSDEYKNGRGHVCNSCLVKLRMHMKTN